MIDVMQFIGQVHVVTEESTGRPVTITIADAGPSPLPDHRPMITLTVIFRDGRRSNIATADAAAGQLMSELLPGYTTAMLADNRGNPLIGRQREKGSKNGGTKFIFTVSCGELDRTPDINALTTGLPLADRLKIIRAYYDAIRRGADSPRTDADVVRIRELALERLRGDAVSERARQRQEMHFFG